jgi:hypothetical protein
MTNIRRSDQARVHEEISALMPWYINGSIGEPERQRVEAHLLECAACRDALAQEEIIYRALTVETAVEYMPAASLKRLQARLDGAVAVAAAPASSDVATAGKPSRRSMPWQGLMAASVALMALALSFLAADRWIAYRARSSAPYVTVTTETPRAAHEVIRAVFVPTITLVELQAILDSAQLRIVSGPTEAGVYSLAANSRRPVSSSLALLREHAMVRFAESTQPSKGPGDTP